MIKAASKILFFLLIFVFLASIFVSKALTLNSEDAATQGIERAEGVLGSAYEVVLKAEQAGANISGLLVRLNDAGELLAEAQVVFGLGEFDDAVFLADYCSDIGGEVRDEADELHVEAHESKITSSWLTMVGSTVGVACVVFVSFWGWHVFKRRYLRRVLGMKPEVIKDES
jgi:hypothetical protein